MSQHSLIHSFSKYLNSYFMSSTKQRLWGSQKKYLEHAEQNI